MGQNVGNCVTEFGTDYKLFRTKRDKIVGKIMIKIVGKIKILFLFYAVCGAIGRESGLRGKINGFKSLVLGGR